jgi:hypothetical protein
MLKMDVSQKWKLIVAQHNTGRKFSYGEVKPFFDDGFNAMSNEIYLAACLCFITGIEMTLRLPLLLRQNRGIDLGHLTDGSPLMSNGLLREAKEFGLPVELLAFPDELDFLSQIKSNEKVKIVKLRNGICHGNLNLFVTDHIELEGVRVIDNRNIKQEANKLNDIVNRWANGFQDFLNS